MLRHPWTGEAKCAAARQYLAKQPEHRRDEATMLAGLTGWTLPDIYRKMGLPAEGPSAGAADMKWYQRIWGK